MKTNCIRVKILVTMIKVLLCENWRKKMFSENSQHVFFLTGSWLGLNPTGITIILIRTFFRSRQRMSFWFISGTQKMLLNRGFCFFLFMSNFFFFVANFSPVRPFFSLRFLSLSIDYSEFYLPHWFDKFVPGGTCCHRVSATFRTCHGRAPRWRYTCRHSLGSGDCLPPHTLCCTAWVTQDCCSYLCRVYSCCGIHRRSCTFPFRPPRCRRIRIAGDSLGWGRWRCSWPGCSNISRHTGRTLPVELGTPPLVPLTPLVPLVTLVPLTPLIPLIPLVPLTAKFELH